MNINGIILILKLVRFTATKKQNLFVINFSFSMY